MAGAAEGFVKHELWEALTHELDEYEASVVRELVRKGGPDDNEKRAMLFALQVVRNFPQRLIEAGQRARRARAEAEEKRRLAQLESIGQAAELL